MNWDNAHKWAKRDGVLAILVTGGYFILFMLYLLGICFKGIAATIGDSCEYILVKYRR